MSFWADKRVVVTGGTGFLGRHLCAELARRGAPDVRCVGRRDWNVFLQDDVKMMMDDIEPHIVFHLAATCGGIGANRAEPGRFLYENAIMGLHLIEECRWAAKQRSLQKLVIAGTVCAYPKHCPVPFKEDDLWNGYPEETNAPYGIAKKMLLVAAQAYRQQYGLNSIMLFPANLYGPGDHFELSTSHVIPAIIRKVHEAKRRGDASITLWGDGRPTREFLYVEDAAKGFCDAAERYDDADPVNLGTGDEARISYVAMVICGLMGYSGKIIWDADKPNGQPRRSLDTSRARDRFGWKATTTLLDGLKKTVHWYLENEGGR